MRRCKLSHLFATIFCWCTVVLIGVQCATYPQCDSSSGSDTECSTYEILKPDKPCCEPTCEDDCSHAICRRNPGYSQPTPTCVCRQGYVRHEQACIPRNMCPSAQGRDCTGIRSHQYFRPALQVRPYVTTPPPPPPVSPSITCGRHEQLTQCRPLCVSTCEKDCSKMAVPAICIPETSCICKPGYVRHDGGCIKSCDCPKRPSPKPESLEYVDFEVLSAGSIDSDELCDYQAVPKLERKKVKQPAVVSTCPKPAKHTTPKPSRPSCGCHENHESVYPYIYPPMCPCKLHRPIYPPAKLADKHSYESTEEDTDIVPYVLPGHQRTLLGPQNAGVVGPGGLQKSPQLTASRHQGDCKEELKQLVNALDRAYHTPSNAPSYDDYQKLAALAQKSNLPKRVLSVTGVHSSRGTFSDIRRN